MIMYLTQFVRLVHDSTTTAICDPTARYCFDVTRPTTFRQEARRGCSARQLWEGLTGESSSGHPTPSSPKFEVASFTPGCSINVQNSDFCRFISGLAGTSRKARLYTSYCPSSSAAFAIQHDIGTQHCFWRKPPMMSDPLNADLRVRRTAFAPKLPKSQPPPPHTPPKDHSHSEA